MTFRDRSDAGRRLAHALGRLDGAKTVVLALPRGGVPVAVEIARANGAPLDLVLVRKIGRPEQPELAVGAIAEGTAASLFVNEELCRSVGLDRTEVEKLATAERAELQRRLSVHMAGRPHLDLAGKTAVLVDDGLATGASMRVAIDAVRSRRPAGIIVAVPVAPTEVVAELEPLVDRLVCLETPRPFMAIGEHYESFRQLEDAEVVDALRTSLRED